MEGENGAHTRDDPARPWIHALGQLFGAILDTVVMWQSSLRSSSPTVTRGTGGAMHAPGLIHARHSISPCSTRHRRNIYDEK